MAGIGSGDVTAVLEDWNRGDPTALERLMPLVLAELRKAAGFYFKRENNDHTLQPTALVSEVCLRLMGWRKVSWESRRQFFAFAGVLMRHILVDHAKAKKTAKRGRDFERVEMPTLVDRAARPPIDSETIIDLDRALDELAEIDPRAAKLVELRFFAGLTVEEAAEALGISRASANRDWVMAKSFLAQRLGDGVPMP